MKVRLFTTLGCHLCEQALSLLHQTQARGFDLTICEVEISDSESLMDRYGIRIPVIQVVGNDQELGWPFNDEALDAFLQQNK